MVTWASQHGRVTSLYQILIRYLHISIFTKFNMAAVCHLVFVWELPIKAHSWDFSSLRINLLTFFRLSSPIRDGPKMSFWGFDPLNVRIYRPTTLTQILARNDAF